MKRTLHIQLLGSILMTSMFFLTNCTRDFNKKSIWTTVISLGEHRPNQVSIANSYIHSGTTLLPTSNLIPCSKGYVNFKIGKDETQLKFIMNIHCTEGINRIAFVDLDPKSSGTVASKTVWETEITGRQANEMFEVFSIEEDISVMELNGRFMEDMGALVYALSNGMMAVYVFTEDQPKGALVGIPRSQSYS